MFLFTKGPKEAEGHAAEACGQNASNKDGVGTASDSPCYLPHTYIQPGGLGDNFALLEHVTVPSRQRTVSTWKPAFEPTNSSTTGRPILRECDLRENAGLRSHRSRRKETTRRAHVIHCTYAYRHRPSRKSSPSNPSQTVAVHTMYAEYTHCCSIHH